MVRRVVMDAGTAVKLSVIERAAFEGRESPWRINDYLALAEVPGSIVFADDAVSSGLLILSLAADEGEIVNLGVVPSARRRGLAADLLQAAISFAIERGIVRLVLEVAVDNVAARALYEYQGFIESGRRHKYYKRPDGTRVDALIYEMRLAPLEVERRPER